MDKEQLKAVFIEEASEIVERLDSKILNYAETPEDRDILNELFRGVHTLKGSANSFGFTRLGKFVHRFEDALDYFRTSGNVATKDTIDLFLESVDLVKELMTYEVENRDGEPENYEKCLSEINALLEIKDGKESSPTAVAAAAAQKDLAQEFGNAAAATADSSVKKVSDVVLEDGERLFEITLKTDADIYFRGYDHATFFRLLCEQGRIIDSIWDLTKVSRLEDLNLQNCLISNVVLRFATRSQESEIAEIFEFLEQNEYEIKPIEIAAKPAEPAAAKEPIAQEPSKETIAEKPAANASTNTRASQDAHKIEVRSFLKIDSSKLGELFDSIGELVIAQNFLSENKLIREINDNNLQKSIDSLSKITRLIQSRVMSLRMVQIKDTFEKMRRVAHDASKKVNKQIKLTVIGEDTEIDKTMVDQLGDPLIHLIRNSIDHGVEASGDDRVKAGKNAEGHVGLRAYHKGGSIAIEVTDDGRGINREAVLKKAIERGLAREGDKLSDQQIDSFIMQAGFSTAEKISDISGRGVGLDVVRSSIEAMHGKIEIESTPDKGSSFRILLPLTLAIIDGMLVRSGDEIFILPTLSILESLRPSADIVHMAQGKGEFINLRNELLPVVRLNHKLGLDENSPEIHESTLVCAENERGRFAILVDELIGRQQVVIKPLGNTLSQLKEISGGAVMGNGEIALIVNVEGLF